MKESTARVSRVSVSNNVEEAYMQDSSKVEFIKAWYEANAHLIEPVIEGQLTDDKEFRAASAAMKGAIYNVENTGRRKARGVVSDDLSSQVVTANYSDKKADWLMSSYVDENGRDIDVYDDGGIVASIVERSQAEIAYGKANESELHGRHSLVEEGFGPRLVHVTDTRGNDMGAMTLAGLNAYEAKEAAHVRALNVESETKSQRRTAKKNLALKVLARLRDRIIASANYADIKFIIQEYAMKFLKRTLSTYTNNGYVTDHCVFIKDGKQTTLNSWFLSYFFGKLWAAVDLSQWKQDRAAKAAKDEEAYNKLQAKLDSMSSICENMHHMAELLRSGKGKAFGISKSDIQPALNYAKANRSAVRGFSKPVFYALIDVMKAA